MPAIDLDAIQAGLVAWVAAGTGLASTKIMWAGQPRPEGTYIELDILALDPIASDWVDLVRKPLVLADDVVESVNTGTGQLTLTAHAYVNGVGPVRFEGADLPAPLVENKDYWLIVDDANKVRVAARYRDTGGWYAPNPKTAITLTSTGSGTIKIVDTPMTVTPGAEAQELARGTRRMTLQLQCFGTTIKGVGHARAILHELVAASAFTSMVERLDAIHLGLAGFESIQTINGIANVTQFEARAVTSCQFFLASERAEDLGIIESVNLLDEDTGWTANVAVGQEP